MPTVKPISELQRNIAAVTSECQSTKQPIYLTKNGSAALVIMDAKAFDTEMSMHHAVREREERVFRAIMRGLEDAKTGKLRSWNQAQEDASMMRANSEDAIEFKSGPKVATGACAS